MDRVRGFARVVASVRSIEGANASPGGCLVEESLPIKPSVKDVGKE